jgi:PAS domain S-box-containing protein
MSPRRNIESSNRPEATLKLPQYEEAPVTEPSRDLALLKDAEKYLAQTEAKYRALLEAAPDAMVVVDRNGVIVLLNVQAEKQFGYNRDELLGQKVTTIIPEGFAERLIADSARTTAEALAQQIGAGIELSGRRKDGSEFPVEIMLSPLESAAGIQVTGQDDGTDSPLRPSRHSDRIAESFAPRRPDQPGYRHGSAPRAPACRAVPRYG